MTRIAVFCSGGGSNLQALIDCQKSGKLGSGEIVLVLSTSRNAYALERAGQNGIATALSVKSSFSSNEHRDEEMLKLLKDNRIDLVVLAGFLGLIGDKVLAEYPNRIINVHPSLIPSFCGKGFYGLRVHQEALSYGVKVTGATVHFVSNVVDGGEIILQKAVDILEGDTPETLQKRVMEQAEWQLLPKAVEMFCSKKLK